MLHTIIGDEKFRKGADLYFSRHDGQAVRVEEFVAAMEEASGESLNQFMNWYTQAGTPVIRVNIDYQQEKNSCTLTFHQSVNTNARARPFHIPLSIAIYGENGELQVSPQKLELREQRQSFTFDSITSSPTPSLLRDFSAPVSIKFNYSDDQLKLLLKHENDGYTRWNAAKQLQSRALLQAIDSWPQQNEYASNNLRDYYSGLLNQTLTTSSETDLLALMCRLLTLPSYSYLAEKQSAIKVSSTWEVLTAFKQTLGKEFEEQWIQLANTFSPTQHYHVDFASITNRLMYMVALSFYYHGKEQLDTSCWQNYMEANNMTLREHSLEMLVWHNDSQYRERALENFLSTANNDSAIINKWFEVQASIPQKNTLKRVKQLADHPLFDWHNPNKLRSLFGIFANRNPYAFHNQQSYEYFADVLLSIDKYNSQIAARLATPFYRWQRYQPEPGKGIVMQLKRIESNNISADLREGVAKSLENYH